MADQFGVARRPLVGRAGEIDAITRLLQDAAGGRGGALLVSGEAEVGKTALVREASARVGEGSDVLWAPCLPLTSLAVPFLPLTSALRDWAADRDAPAPVLGGSGQEGPTGFDTLLDNLCRQHPVLLARRTVAAGWAARSATTEGSPSLSHSFPDDGDRSRKIRPSAAARAPPDKPQRVVHHFAAKRPKCTADQLRLTTARGTVVTARSARSQAEGPGHHSPGQWRIGAETASPPSATTTVGA